MPRGGERILFISPSNPYSTRGFSGTLFSARAALESQFEEFEVASFGFFAKAARALNKLARPFVERPNFIFHQTYGEIVSKYASLVVQRRKPDAIIAVAASPYLAYLKTDAPIIYCSDATFKAISRLYDEFRNLPPWSARAADEFERRSLAKATAIVLSSEWARESAITDYDVDPEKVHVLPYGPNFKRGLLPETQPAQPEGVQSMLRLLYVGMDWKRKGGAFAVSVARALRDLGQPVHLDIVGRIAPDFDDPGFVTCHGMLKKNVDADARRLAALYERSHLLILPTVADATPVVFSEAAAFAVPAVTFDVGGVASAVIDGKSGLIFPPSASEAEVARRIKNLIGDPEAYSALRQSTFRHYRTTANWDSWSHSVAELARAAIRARAEGVRPDEPARRS
jgi:glycosyltransferase involved in cell wall biosynthesis